jgi:uncharacterized membrane protein
MNTEKSSSSRSLIIGVVVVGALLVGAVAWSVASARSLSQKLEAAETELRELKQNGQKSPSSEIASLRRRLEQMDAAYLQLEDDYRLLSRQMQERQSAAGLQAAPVPALTDTNAASRTANGGSWMERLQREDPERYKQMMEAREQRRQQANQWYQEQIAQLDQRAQSAPTREEAELATQIADTLDRINQLRDSWRAIRELPEDQRQVQAEALSAQDRALQLENLAAKYGVQGQSKQTFAETVQQIYDNTRYTPQRSRGGSGGWGGDGQSSQQSSAPQR